MPSLVLTAPAKLNLYLEVLGRRADGFHDLEMVFQTLTLADVVEVTWEPGGMGTVCTCDDPTLPTGTGNLAWRAAEAFRVAAGLTGGLRVAVTKRIPHGAGLGGGSSDAASVLLALQRLTGAPLAESQLAQVALDLGSDVPFFLMGGTAHARGRGEILTALPPVVTSTLTVVMPPVVLPTPRVFSAMTDQERGPRPLRGAAWATQALQDLPSLLFNRLSDPAVRCCPEVGQVLEHLGRQGFPCLMSGSGAACFALGPVAVPPGWRSWTTTTGPGAGVALPS